MLLKTFVETQMDLQLNGQVHREMEPTMVFARNTTGQTGLPALASMAIEQDLFLELKHSDDLYNRVNELFLMEERRMELCTNDQTYW